MKSPDDVKIFQVVGLLEVVEERVAFLVDRGRGVMRDLTSPVAETDSRIERRGAQPDGPAVCVSRVGLPEADMVALPRIVSDGLLEGQVLLMPPQIQVA